MTWWEWTHLTTEVILISVLDSGSLSSQFIPDAKSASTHGLRAGLEVVLRRKIPPPLKIRVPAFQSLASHFSDLTTVAHKSVLIVNMRFYA
jgi:hypothetical protein